ncbi:hypothetical protein [Roseiconus lacunae]|uniref:hypothetical protein n=1 Tax=Roseiconus lacunae TaxID=2605694 RepID=UPI001E3099CC|nr:hypothetical protein [Roseiconus lacunae]MCD0457915.1 hypothetical protein [Roseiconus lacunae]
MPVVSNANPVELDFCNAATMRDSLKRVADHFDGKKVVFIKQELKNRSTGEKESRILAIDKSTRRGIHFDYCNDLVAKQIRGLLGNSHGDEIAKQLNSDWGIVKFKCKVNATDLYRSFSTGCQETEDFSVSLEFAKQRHEMLRANQTIHSATDRKLKQIWKSINIDNSTRMAAATKQGTTLAWDKLKRANVIMSCHAFKKGLSNPGTDRNGFCADQKQKLSNRLSQILEIAVDDKVHVDHVLGELKKFMFAYRAAKHVDTVLLQELGDLAPAPPGRSLHNGWQSVQPRVQARVIDSPTFISDNGVGKSDQVQREVEKIDAVLHFISVYGGFTRDEAISYLDKFHVTPHELKVLEKSAQESSQKGATEWSSRELQTMQDLQARLQQAFTQAKTENKPYLRDFKRESDGLLPVGLIDCLAKSDRFTEGTARHFINLSKQVKNDSGLWSFYLLQLIGKLPAEEARQFDIDQFLSGKHAG